MGNKLLTIVGVVLIVVGAFWALQGFGAIGGSFMSGNSAFEVIGPAVAIIGLLLTVIGVRRARSA
ncbi:MAG TPA: hypothetical protein VFQ44_06045 [Streptosporangiaceae bacterium]|nr:hypothetical protein [Streptosporangiaceae bacterium]